MIETCSVKESIEGKMWLGMEEYIFIRCNEDVGEDIIQYFHQFAKDIEKNAFINGYKNAFKLYLEVFHESKKT